MQPERYKIVVEVISLCDSIEHFLYKMRRFRKVHSEFSKLCAYEIIIPEKAAERSRAEMPEESPGTRGQTAG